MATQHLICNDISHRVGTCILTKVWGHPRLMDIDNPYIETKVQPQLSEAIVYMLMAIGNKEWDTYLLKDIFNSRDVEAILKVPISDGDLEDIWYWRGDIRGVYTVRSTYRLLRQETHNNFIQSDFTSWDRIWKLNLPPRLQNLIWRGAHGIIQTRYALLCKRVYTDSNCPFYNMEMEINVHIFLQCMHADQVWSTLGSNLPDRFMLDF